MNQPSHWELARRVMYILPPEARSALVSVIGSGGTQEINELLSTPLPALTAPLGAVVTAPFQNEEKAFDALRGCACIWQATLSGGSLSSGDIVKSYSAATGNAPGNIEASLAADPRVGGKSDSNFLLNLALAVPTAGMLGGLMKSARLGWIATLGGLVLQKVADQPSAPAATNLARIQALGEVMDDLEGVNVLAAWSLAQHPSQGKTPSEWADSLKKLATEAPTLLFGLGTLMQSGLIPKAITSFGSRFRQAAPLMLPAGDPSLRDVGPAEAGDPDVEVARFLRTVTGAGAETGSLGRLIKQLKPSVLPLLATAVPGGPLIAAAAGGAAKPKRAAELPPPQHVDRVISAAQSGALDDHEGSIDPAKLGALFKQLETETALREQEE